jgi:hypothetical protein
MGRRMVDGGDGPPMEVDFAALNDALYAWACRNPECNREVCHPDSYCMGCFVGLLTGDTPRD